ncbi:MAG: GNAT family N-acetyltransferase [Steroidobacteraceae bacterium]
MALEPARTTDAEAVVSLVESAFRGEPSRVGWTTEADLLGGRRTGGDEISSILDDPDQALLLKRDKAGGLEASVVLRREGEHCWLGMLAVKPALQDRGIGRQVMAEAESWAQAQWDSRRMRMSVIAQRGELISWYERRGYRLTGERKAFFYGDPRFGEPRRGDLFFVLMEKVLPPAG